MFKGWLGLANPLQCSCLENPRNGGALWAAVYGVAQSWTQLKQLSKSSSSRSRACQVVLVGKNLSANAGDIRDTSLIPKSGRSLGEGHGNSLQYSCLENSMVGGTCQAMVHGVTESDMAD